MKVYLEHILGSGYTGRTLRPTVSSFYDLSGPLICKQQCLTNLCRKGFMCTTMEFEDLVLGMNRTEGVRDALRGDVIVLVTWPPVSDQLLPLRWMAHHPGL